MNFLLNRLKERSTWVGILTLLAVFGVTHLSPEKTEALLVAIPSVIGAILVFLPDKKTIPGGDFNPNAEVRKADPVIPPANPKTH